MLYIIWPILQVLKILEIYPSYVFTKPPDFNILLLSTVKDPLISDLKQLLHSRQVFLMALPDVRVVWFQ